MDNINIKNGTLRSTATGKMSGRQKRSCFISETLFEFYELNTLLYEMHDRLIIIIVIPLAST